MFAVVPRLQVAIYEFWLYEEMWGSIMLLPIYHQVPVEVIPY